MVPFLPWQMSRASLWRGLLGSELLVHLPAVGVIDWVDDGEQVQGLGDPPVLGERLPQGRGVALAAEHP